MNEDTNVVEKIKAVIEEMRPYLNMDGGDVEFVRYDEEDNVVFVKLSGACAMCVSQDDTLELGLLEAIQEKVPEVKKIINTYL